MHTISFYSFKGGVGRTLALVNIGVELAMTGRKVLLVDFDLEAPGIDTFEELLASDRQLGLVDYITDFMKSGTPQDVLKYIYKASLAERATGELWVMAAGRRDAGYGQKLAAINWQHLYGQMEGYLFVEDLKSQWAEKVMPDYVLIDSRTGHTEVGGICTRQLPDTVVILFMPNEQNLDGLKYVVKSIRNEKIGPAPKEITIEFVVSNVPNLDDEEAILSRLKRKFANDLAFSASHTIHRYDSLALLGQSIFVTQRPKSRLARQYRTLLQKLVEHNIEDKAGALRYLERQMKTGYLDGVESEQEVRKRIQVINDRHALDHEIIFNSALLYKERGLLDESNFYFEKAVELARQNGGLPAPRLLIERAKARAEAGRNPDAKADLLEVVNYSKVNSFELDQTIELLRRIDEGSLAILENSPAIQALSLNETGMIASSLSTSRPLQEVSERILMAAKARLPSSVKGSITWRSSTILTLIAIGKFREALAEIGEDHVRCQEPDITDVFNFAMALWGATKDVSTDLLEKVVELDGDQADRDANGEECLALCLGLLGRKAKAKSRLAKARRRIEMLPIPTFSCWSYTTVKPPVFEQHLDAIEALIEGDQELPEFMCFNGSQTGADAVKT